MFNAIDDLYLLVLHLENYEITLDMGKSFIVLQTSYNCK